MGSRRGGDGDGMPPRDGGLPDLPPEWGVVVIPDDLHELERESTVLRRERRRLVRRNRWRRRFGLPPIDPDADTPPIGAPLLIMAITIVAAITSLLAITLSTRPAPNALTPGSAAGASTTSHRMIDLALTDQFGDTIRLNQSFPAIILLLDGCQCEQLIRDTVQHAPAKVSVLIVDRVAPAIPAGLHATALADPEQALLATYAGGPDQNASPAGVAAVVLVDTHGTVTRAIKPVSRIADFQADLGHLVS